MRRYLVLTTTMVVAVAVVALVAQGRPLSLSGTVRNQAAVPVADATVTAVGATGTAHSTQTDAAGRFGFAGLPPGKYTVEARRLGFSTATMAVVVSEGSTTAIDLLLASRAAAQPPTEARDENAKARATAPAPPPSMPIPMLMQPGIAGGVVGGIVGGVPPSVQAYSGTPLPNTEAYARIDDNVWHEATRSPLSTFSIDVDTASYANVRRFIVGGALPPKDAVRIEEFVNYFGYDYPEPDGRTPFSVTTALSDAPWNPKHRLALIGVQARRMDEGSTPARNLVFLIDVSGSMQAPNKLTLVKASLAMLARNLTARDRIALVVYAGAAGVVLPPTSGADRSTILAALASLEAGGSTNGAQGLRLAYDVARRHFVPGGVNRVLLATDGDFNVGATSEGDLTRLIEAQRADGISLSVLGFGMGNLKDSTMETLADRGDGNYAYIDTLSEARKVLVEEAGGTLVTVAKDVKLQVEFNPRAVAAYRLIGYENRLLQDRDFNDDTKDAGDMGAGHSVTALYELIPAGEPLDGPGIDPLKYQHASSSSSAQATGDAREAMTVKVRYKQPSASTSTLTSVVVPNARADSPALQFASAVAEFGMLLRESEFKGASSFADVRTRAARARGADPFGHRAEFLRLVDAAESLVDLQHSTR